MTPSSVYQFARRWVCGQPPPIMKQRAIKASGDLASEVSALRGEIERIRKNPDAFTALVRAMHDGDRKQ